ncbi:hypothetical protein O3G_MSEX006298 [Manduca sexta]|uniref:Beta-N-acetylhexosaminidase n=1 Tax=Manduca sexta TaxID=7130 RepID=A0A921Z238_MANSE|nr:hypothetical protein O3G_MSEX006298 [Manduca sexta]
MRSTLIKMRSVKLKCFILTVIILSVYLFIFYVLLDIWFFQKKNGLMSSIVLSNVIVHIDFKGSPPKLSYLESLLPILKSHGVNGLLMEYEDMFPYEGKLINISAKNAYGRSELQKFIIAATNMEFEIIPLVQTFGHLEHVLKLQEFQHLREMPLYPDSICPTKEESRNLLKDMLRQIIFFHNSISELKYIHIGCDEVYHINKCKQCAKEKLGNNDLFVNHVNLISEIVKLLSPATVVLIWDDMLREIKPMEWEDFDNFVQTEPVYWDYKPNLAVSHLNLLKYRKKFDNIWIASAFKGADGPIATIPNLKNRFMNHFSWLNLILDYKFGGDDKVYNFKGIILTGWSRYNHMDPPCELLPLALPSLILNLLLIKKFQSGIVVDDDETSLGVDGFFAKHLDTEFNQSLKCKHIGIENMDYSSCTLHSLELYTILERYRHTTENIESHFYNDKIGLKSIEYYSKQGYVNINNVRRHMKWSNETLYELIDIEKMLYGTMLKYYNREFTKEYVNFKTYANKKRLKELYKTLRAYTKPRHWPRRPAKSLFVALK